jgi:hypothetical protein
VTQLNVSVDTKGREGFMAKHVAIHSNDRVTPTVSVTLMLNVQREAARKGP